MYDKRLPSGNRISCNSDISRHPAAACASVRPQSGLGPLRMRNPSTHAHSHNTSSHTRSTLDSLSRLFSPLALSLLLTLLLAPSLSLTLLLAHPFAALSISLLSAPSSRSLCLIHHAAPTSDLPCCASPAFSRLRPPGATALFDGESPPEAKPQPSYTLRAPAPPAARRIRASTCG